MNNKENLLVENRVAAYIRVSSTEQVVNGDSLRMQKEELQKWAEANGKVIYDYYIDDGYSATTLKRPALQKMLSESNEFGMIIFVKLDRFSRGVANYYTIMKQLEKTNTDWKAIFESYETTSAQGRLLVNMMLSIAENEASLTSERTKAVFKNKIENGECIIAQLPCGLKKIKKVVDGNTKTVIEIDEDAAMIMREAFQHFLKYGSMRMTQIHLQDKYGYFVDRSTFRHALQHKLYIGTYVHKEHGEFPNFCPPLIDEKTFYKVQEILKTNSRVYHDHKNSKTKKPKYIFGGLMNCPHCGKKLGGSAPTRQRKTMVPYVRKYYRCSRYSNQRACDYPHIIGEAQIEQFLLDNVRSLLENKIITHKIEQAKPDGDEEKVITSRIATIEKKLSRLRELYYDDVIRKEDYEKDFVIFNTELTELQKEMEKLKTTKPHFDVNFYKDFLSQDFETLYNELDEIEKRRLWLSVIKEIKVFNKEITPIFY